MYTYIHTHAHVRAHACTHTRARARTHTHIYTIRHIYLSSLELSVGLQHDARAKTVEHERLKRNKENGQHDRVSGLPDLQKQGFTLHIDCT